MHCKFSLSLRFSLSLVFSCVLCCSLTHSRFFSIGIRFSCSVCCSQWYCCCFCCYCRRRRYRCCYCCCCCCYVLFVYTYSYYKQCYTSVSCRKRAFRPYANIFSLFFLKEWASKIRMNVLVSSESVWMRDFFGIHKQTIEREKRPQKRTRLHILQYNGVECVSTWIVFRAHTHTMANRGKLYLSQFEFIALSLSLLSILFRSRSAHVFVLVVPCLCIWIHSICTHIHPSIFIHSFIQHDHTTISNSSQRAHKFRRILKKQLVQYSIVWYQWIIE